MIGLTDGELQLEIAQWASSVAETGKKRHCSCIDCCVCVCVCVCFVESALALLRPLTKLMFQLTEASGEQLTRTHTHSYTHTLHHNSSMYH